MNFLWDALQAAGNVLDTPGSVVRGVLAGEPGRAVSGIFHPEQRVSGREMLENWGLLGPNASGLDWGDVGGFLAEQVTDPLAWMGGRAAAGLLRETGGNLAAPSSLTRALRVGPQTGVYHPLEVAEVYGKDVPFLTPSLASDLSESWISRLTPREEAAVRYYTQAIGDINISDLAKWHGFAPEGNYFYLNRALRDIPFSPTITPDFEKAFRDNIAKQYRERLHLDQERIPIETHEYLDWLKVLDSAVSKAPSLDEEIQLLRGSGVFANLKMPRNERMLRSNLELAYGLRSFGDDEPLTLSPTSQVSAPVMAPSPNELVNEMDWYREMFLPRETVEKSFLSASWHPTYNLLGSSPGHINLVVKPGTPIPIAGRLGWEGESEIILPRNALVDVLDIKPTGESLENFYRWMENHPGSYITSDEIPERYAVDPNSASVLAVIRGIAR